MKREGNNEAKPPLDAVEESVAEGTSRREFLGAAVAGAAFGTGALGLFASGGCQSAPGSASAIGNQPTVSAARSARQPLEVDSPMAKWKRPQPREWIKGARARWSFPNWQSGNDDSVYYNMHVPEFFHCGIAVPAMAPRALERNIDARLADLRFEAMDGSRTPKLRDYLTGPKNVQAMMMAHRGKVVFETYPGMNPTDMHIWMSASKTTCGLLVMLLEAQGKIDLAKPITDYARELKGSAWDSASVRDTMNMATGLDIEESFANLTNPKSFIAQFFASMLTGKNDDWAQVMRKAQPLPNEKAGTHMRYSTSATQALTLAVEHASGQAYADAFQARVWSKIGVTDPFLVAQLSDGTAIGGGGNYTAIEDFLRYAMIYTPSWRAVSDEQIVTADLLKRIQTLGDPKAFENCTEQEYGHQWFGEKAERNSAQWDDVFADGAMFKHGNMGQGIYVDPARDFCGVHFALGPNDGPVDWSPGYQRAAAKLLAGG